MVLGLLAIITQCKALKFNKVVVVFWDQLGDETIKHSKHSKKKDEIDVRMIEPLDVGMESQLRKVEKSLKIKFKV